MRASCTLRIRLSAIVCMLLLLFASTAQVAHHHDDVVTLQKSSLQKGSSSKPQQPQKDAESLCPLCIAMHSALPSTPQIAVAPLERVQQVSAAEAVSSYVLLWRFHLFERPPPSPARA